MLLKVFRTWKKYIKVHLEQKKMCQKMFDLFAINRELTMDKMRLIVIKKIYRLTALIYIYITWYIPFKWIRQILQD